LLKSKKMSYVSWPDVASEAFVKDRVKNQKYTKRQLIELKDKPELGEGEVWGGKVDTAFLTPQPGGLVCVEMDCAYRKEGAGTDEMTLALYDDTTNFPTPPLYYKTHTWESANGGGTRGGTLFPLMCVLKYDDIINGIRIVIGSSIQGNLDKIFFDSDIQVEITQHVK
jgi:hypothetical protein